MDQAERDCEQRYFELCEFVSIIAHDLRTPLTAIRGYAQLMQRQARAGASAVPVAPAGPSPHLDLILQQSDRLAEYTEWLLEIARLETRRVALHRVRVDLEEVTADVIATLGLDVPVERTVSTTLIVDADLRRLRHMIRAMLNFAAGRASAPLPPVVLGLSEGAGQAGQVIVDDAADALAAEEQERLFSRLVRPAEDGYRPMLAHFPLVIASGMAEAHGGQLEVESPVVGSDRGARLRLSLPLATSAT